eukprot:403366974
MTADSEITSTTIPKDLLNQPILSWRNLPSDPEHAQQIMFVISIFLAIWGILFFVGCYHHPIPKYYEKRMSKEDKLIWRFRVINSYHGASAGLLAFYWYCAFFTTEYTRKITTYEMVMLANTSSYLVMDGLFMWFENFLDTGNLIHHVFGIVAYYSIAYCGYDYTFQAMHLLPAEFSNVAMHMREVFKRMGMRYTKWYYLNDFAYYIEYFICRGFWIPSVFYFIFSCPTSNPVSLIIYPLHVIMSWYFCSYIPPMITQRFKEYKKIRAAGIEIQWVEPVSEEVLKKIGVDTFELYHT